MPHADVEPAQPKSDRRRPVAIDLFAGAGGLSLGFEQAGFDVLAAAEFDPIHAAVHRYNFPCTEVLCGDVSELTGADIERAARAGWKSHGRRGDWDGELDAIVGGPPCQGFSTMGRRRQGDRRNELVFDFARLVTELKPRYFAMENVPGMASFPLTDQDDSPLLLDALIDELREVGYKVEQPQFLNACLFGVPQDRRRLLLIGSRADQERPDSIEPTHRPRPRRPDHALPRGTKIVDEKYPRLPMCPSVDDAIGDLPDADDYRGLLVSDAVELEGPTMDLMEDRASRYARSLRGLEKDGSDRSRPRAWDVERLTSSCRTTHADKVEKRFKATDQGHSEPISRLYRLHADGISTTLRAGTHYDRGSFNAPRPIHPTHPRVITVREAARLHGFPDWFRLHWTKWHGFRQVGNSLPPAVGRAVGREIVKAMGLTPRVPATAIDMTDESLLYLENLAAAKQFDANLDRIPHNRLRQRPSRPDEDAKAA